MYPATTHHPPPHPSPLTSVIRRRPELNTKQRAGFRRLLTSTAITINQHNPKSGASYEWYEGYRFARLTSRNFQSWSGSSSRSLPQSSPMSSIVARACLGSIWRVRKSPSPWLLRDRVFEKLCCKECRMTAKTNSSPISSLRAEPKEEDSATIKPQLSSPISSATPSISHNSKPFSSPHSSKIIPMAQEQISNAVKVMKRRKTEDDPPFSAAQLGSVP